jgi:aryl-alcohol dehydrogenase-like predicted oxidoreductase
MDYTALGRSGLRVSRASLGTMNFLDAGHNLIDTADTYRGGTSEEVVGRAIAHRRAEVVLAAKGAAPQGDGPDDRGLSRAHLTRALEASPRSWAPTTSTCTSATSPTRTPPPRSPWAALDAFMRSGRVRYPGCSNFTAASIVSAQRAQRGAGTPFSSLQANYSLIARAIEAESVPTCRQHGLGILAYSPLGSGLLAGRYQRRTAPTEGSRLADWAAMPSPMARALVNGLLAERHFDTADEVAAVAAELGTSTPTVTLTHQPARDHLGDRRPAVGRSPGREPPRSGVHPARARIGTLGRHQPMHRDSSGHRPAQRCLIQRSATVQALGRWSDRYRRLSTAARTKRGPSPTPAPFQW